MAEDGEKAAHTDAKKRILGKAAINGEQGDGNNHTLAAQLPDQPQPITCPYCRSEGPFDKDGLRDTAHGQVQRWYCKRCERRFSARNNRDSGLITHGKPLKNNSDWHLKTRDDISSVRQVCVTLERGAKNLESATETKTVAGEESQDIKGKLLQFALYMQKENKAEATIASFNHYLRRLASNSDLNDPEAVKEALAKVKIAENSKASYCVAYGAFLKFQGKAWKAPKYTFQQRIPEFLPTEQEIDELIAGCGRKTSTILQTLKETGMRIGEALSLPWTAIDNENRTITLNTPEKHSLPRIFKVSPKLIGMIEALPKDHERVFGRGSVRDKQHIFKQQRTRIALKIGNPRLAKIHFHLIRHWKGTMEYHKTHSPDHVKRLLGHRSLMSTEIYINMDRAIFSENDQEFHVKVAENLEEACKLLEVGFDYVTDIDGKKLFRKRK